MVFLKIILKFLAANKLPTTIPLPCCAEQHSECMVILTDPDDKAYKGKT